MYARSRLRESIDFFNSKSSLLDIKNNEDLFDNCITEKILLDNFSVETNYNYKDIFFFFIFRVADGITFVFLPFVYCSQLMSNVGVSSEEIVTQKFFVSLIGCISTFIIALLVYKIPPFKIVIFRTWGFVLLCLPLPFIIKDLPSKYTIFFIQIWAICFNSSEVPASPIIFKRIPIFKRSTYIFIITSIGAAISCFVITFLLKFLNKYLGDYALYPLLLPIALMSVVGAYYFNNQNKKIEHSKLD